MILRFQDSSQESDYPLSEDDQYKEALYQFFESCSKHNVSKGTANGLGRLGGYWLYDSPPLSENNAFDSSRVIQVVAISRDGCGEPYSSHA